MILFPFMIMLGAWYRLAMTGFTILWILMYLMQNSGYNNHYYLMILLCLFMIFMPANANCSVDAKKRPSIKTTYCAQYQNLTGASPGHW